MSTGLNISADATIKCSDAQIGENVCLGPGVQIECEYMRLGDNVRIGCEKDSDFRAIAGVRIRARRIEMGNDVVVGRSVLLCGGDLLLGRRVQIKDWNDVNVRKRLIVGAGGTIGNHCEISGVDIEFGRDLWMLPHVKVGGGSAFEIHSSLRAGDFLHVGMHSLINTARAVVIGDEVGLGTRTALYTHGAYSSELRGAPVAFGEIFIGDRTWIPGATVNPGVTIGNDCIIAVGSVVLKSIPAGSLAGGIPAKVLRENAFPRRLSIEEQRAVLVRILSEFAVICSSDYGTQFDPGTASILLNPDFLICYDQAPSLQWILERRARGFTRMLIMAGSQFPCAPDAHETFIDLENLVIQGSVCSVSERLVNQLRRHGIRFRYESVNGIYQKWQEE